MIVRLKVKEVFSKYAQKGGFNSMIVRLKGHCDIRVSQGTDRSFNSMIVRLKVMSAGSTT